MISNRWRSKLRKAGCKSARYNVTICCLMVSKTIMDGRLGLRTLKWVTIQRLLYTCGLLVLVEKIWPGTGASCRFWRSWWEIGIWIFKKTFRVCRSANAKKKKGLNVAAPTQILRYTFSRFSKFLTCSRPSAFLMHAHATLHIIGL